MANILTTEEAAAKLKVNVITIRRYLIKGMIPGRKIGKQWRINEEDFDNFIATGNVRVEPEPVPSKKKRK